LQKEDSYGLLQSREAEDRPRPVGSLHLTAISPEEVRGSIYNKEV